MSLRGSTLLLPLPTPSRSSVKTNGIRQGVGGGVLLLVAEIAADLQSGCDGGSVVGVGNHANT